MTRLTARDLRALKILAFVLPAFAVAYAVPRAREAWRGHRERAEQAVVRLERERAIRDSRAAFESTARGRRARYDALASTLPSHSNLEAAQSEFLRRLRSIALSQHVAVLDLNATAADTLVPGVQRLTAQLRGESDLGGALRLLRALAQLRAPTRVSRVIVERVAPEPNGGMGASDGRNVLRIGMQIESLALISSTERVR